MKRRERKGQGKNDKKKNQKHEEFRRCCTRHKHTGTLDKFNTHTLGVINLTLVPAKELGNPKP